MRVLKLDEKKTVLRIRAERLRQGLRQIDLAVRADVPLSELSRIESGLLRPYDKYRQRLASTLGIDPAELLDEVQA